MNHFNRDHNCAVWFDIPVIDLERAVLFYKEVLANNVAIESFDNFRFAVLDHQDGNGGCLVENAGEVTGTTGVLLYLNVHGRIKEAIERVTQHGGQIVQELHSLGPHGFRALILDSEGNRVALHSEDDQ